MAIFLTVPSVIVAFPGHTHILLEDRHVMLSHRRYMTPGSDVT